MQWQENMLVAVNCSNGYRVYEIASVHPDRILLMDKEENLLALSTDDFNKRKPFPVGRVVTDDGWFWSNREWEYGESSKKG